MDRDHAALIYNQNTNILELLFIYRQSKQHLRTSDNMENTELVTPNYP